MQVAVSSLLGIEIVNARLQYRDSADAVLDDFTMSIPAGKWSCILGRSGCGKTTLLRYLADLLGDKVTWSGELSISDGQPLNHRIAYMAQQDLLLPWLTVMDNVCLSTKFSPFLKAKKNSKAVTSSPGHYLESAQKKATELLALVGLEEYANVFPRQLSGGMRQRVALARTLMQDKPVVLMDEPFSALDAVTRHKLQTLSAQLLKEKTVILITHDPQEAVRLADRLYVMQGVPAKAISLPVPQALSPRDIDAECAALQQAIYAKLEQDHE
ncbi:ABC transporter ATP-binding protein [Vibrio sinensis]|uniref:ABC transporter ATP-binding protein n=1 Tax=Vibrio sinensis TaxID=2302434 RepID=A0A3A6QIA6_9VIBR|nr:ABC transporter ATP-binding protein [Vibrio sinensis]RJX66229.1 ABC transporter ATP-binding protein [Vibrio sinensis]